MIVRKKCKECIKVGGGNICAEALNTVYKGRALQKKCLRASADSEGPDPHIRTSDQGLHCPFTESLDTTECMNGEQRPG